ncbi:FlaG protein [compost metagenome]
MDISKLSSPLSPPALGRELPRSGPGPASDAAAQSAASRASDTVAEPSDLNSAVANMSSFVQSVQRNLAFSIDDSSGEVVIKVMDHDSGKLVRQIPSEEALRLSEQLEELRSLMFETRA